MLHIFVLFAVRYSAYNRFTRELLTRRWHCANIAPSDPSISQLMIPILIVSLGGKRRVCRI